MAAIDASALDDEPADVPGRDVLNGIAFDPARDSFLVTGKRWPTTFECASSRADVKGERPAAIRTGW